MPESVLKSISKQILKALGDIHMKLKTSHGVICPSQILLERNGNVKVRNILENNEDLLKIHSFLWDLQVNFSQLRII